MEILQLRRFMVVAEELSFRRAAERLNVSQPPLSLHIQKLEEELGVELFVREKRQIRLTEAGSSLLIYARLILDLERRAADDARRAGAGEVGRLSIGFTDDFLHGFLAQLLARFQAQHPSVMIESQLGLSADLAHQVSQGLIDVAFICPPLPASVRDLGCIDLPRARIVALLPEAHPLARSDEKAIELNALRDEAFVAASSMEPTGFFVQILKLMDVSGFVPHVRYETRSASLSAELVAEGGCVALVSESSAAPVAGVTALPLVDEEAYVKRAMVWSTDNPAPLLDRFRAAMLE